MFRTNVSAQLPWLNDQTMLWRWVEIVAVNLHFLVTVHQPETQTDSEFNTTLIFSNLNEALAMINEPENTFEVVRMDLLSPGHQNGSSGFKLDQLSEIWMEKETGKQRYVFADGSRMETKFAGSTNSPVNYEKVLSLPV